MLIRFAQSLNNLCPKTPKSGFSLVELSIVLVILGLLVGGVLSGQSLIRASELRKIVTTQDKYRGAVMSFRDKYFALPSDMTNATAFWGAKTATGCTNNAGAPRNAANGTCDGDGDGFIYAATSANSEYYRVWEQLSRAGLVEGSYAYSTSSGLTEAQSIGVEIPALGVGRGGVNLQYVGVVNGVNMRNPSLHGNTGHFFIMGGASPFATNLQGGITKPDEAYSIDIKIDDGSPASGTMLARYDGSIPDVLTTRCTSFFNNPSAVYNLSFTAQTCFLAFKLQ